MDPMTWKAKLGSKIPPDLGKEIDVFETQMELRKLGKIDEKLFAEFEKIAAVTGLSGRDRISPLFGMKLALSNLGIKKNNIKIWEENHET